MDTFRNIIKKIWGDPVWSKVIATGVVGVAVTLFLNDTPTQPLSPVPLISGNSNIINQGNNNVFNPINITELSNDRGLSSEFIREPTQQNEVFDSISKLTWQKIARCGDASTYNWTKANMYCKSIKISGNSNWRLPTMQELKDVLERKPALSSNTNCFNDSYWSSTLDETSEYAYLVPNDISRNPHLRKIDRFGYTWCVHD